MVWYFGNPWGNNNPPDGEATDINEKDVHDTMDVDEKPILEREWALMDVDLPALLFDTDPPMQPTGEPMEVD